ncbi:7TM diverse intracellular signaling domain-containing protein [Oligoflexus tunisiensis]|uniref:7TM diverse intracellular signaling domain-containing protein n=1 Tax=Oligoflexus tunisiensis TaxID=708132 RepID=UPI000A7CE552|nr:7TM diverse intracellular signaling domain-containing protein [Oligoflexus tunisiensis]
MRFSIETYFRILILLGILCPVASEAQAGEASIIDVRELTTRHGAINLDGPWEFYWQKFVDPLDRATAPDDFMPAGTGWKKRDYPGEGYATYRIRVKGFEFHQKGYEIGLSYVLSSYRLFMYPEQDPSRMVQYNMGEPGETRRTTFPRTLAHVFPFHPRGPDEVWVITFHIACFQHSNGGLRSTPEIAPGSLLSERGRQGMDSAFFCAGILFIMFLYNLMLFIRRPEDKASLIGALAILAMALRSVATDNMLYHLMGKPNQLILDINHVLEYTTMTGTGILFCYFLQLTFPSAAFPRVLKNFSILSSPLLVLTLVTPPTLFSRFLPLYQVSTAFFIFLGVVVVIRAFRMRLDGSLAIFLSGIFILVSFFYDLLVNYGWLPHPFILQYATAVYTFLGSETLARRSAKAFRTAEKLQKDLKKEVYKQTAEIKQIMASIPQGIFTMGPSLCIEGQYSQHLEFILQTEALEGREALPLLFAQSNVDAEQLSMLHSALLASMGEELLVWEFNQHCLIREFQVNNSKLGVRTFELDWHPIPNPATRIEQILVTLRDVTDWHILQAANKQREEEFNLLLELVPIPVGRWRDFVKQCHELLAKVLPQQAHDSARTEPDVRAAAIALHTLKGLSRSIGCRHLSVAVHSVEERLRSLTEHTASYRILRQSVDELQQLLIRYETLWTDMLKRSLDEGQRQDNRDDLLEELAYQRQQARTVQAPQPLHGLIQTLDSYIQNSLYMSLFSLLREVTEAMIPLAKELGRLPPDIHLEGTDAWVHKRTARVLRMALVHQVRNALDHGLETPDERQKMGKDPRGTIYWKVTVNAGKVCISCRDDGRGLDLEALISKAAQLGFSREALNAMPHGVMDVMFISGLSSRDAISEVSGRGIGMDALRSMIMDIGGNVWAQRLGRQEAEKQLPAFETVIELPAHQFLPVNEPVPLSVGF